MSAVVAPRSSHVARRWYPVAESKKRILPARKPPKRVSSEAAERAVEEATDELVAAAVAAKGPQPWHVQLNFQGVGTEEEIYEVVDALVELDDHRGLFFTHAFIGEMDVNQVVEGSPTDQALTGEEPE